MVTLTALRERIRREETAPAVWALGAALRDRREFTEALVCARRAIELQPDESRYYRNAGTLLARIPGYEEEAAPYFERALVLAPEKPENYEALGRFYAVHLQWYDTVRVLASRGIAAFPERPNMYTCLGRGCVHVAEGDDVWRLAERWLPPNGRRDLLEIGVARALTALGRYEEARAFLLPLSRRADVHGHLLALFAQVHDALRDRQAARACYERALRLTPNDVTLTGQYAELIWRTGDHLAVKRLVRSAPVMRGETLAPETPMWDPAYLQGRTVLVTNEGGFGDIVQWSRVALLLRAAGARVVFETVSPLRRLHETLDGVDAVVVRYDEYPPYDVACRADLALVLVDWDWPTLEAQVPYLRVPSGVQHTGRAQRSSGDGRLHIGVEWRSENDMRKADPYRAKSIPFRALRRLAEIPDVVCHSLHIGIAGVREMRAHASEVPMSEFTDQDCDFAGTAAALSAVDLVVTVDTSVAHVAGALGKPTLMMLAYHADPRWGEASGPTQWYPSVHAIRQPSPGDWDTVLARVADDLRARVLEGARAHAN